MFRSPAGLLHRGVDVPTAPRQLDLFDRPQQPPTPIEVAPAPPSRPEDPVVAWKARVVAARGGVRCTLTHSSTEVVVVVCGVFEVGAEYVACEPHALNTRGIVGPRGDVPTFVYRGDLEHHPLAEGMRWGAAPIRCDWRRVPAPAVDARALLVFLDGEQLAHGPLGPILRARFHVVPGPTLRADA